MQISRSDLGRPRHMRTNLSLSLHRLFDTSDHCEAEFPVHNQGIRIICAIIMIGVSLNHLLFLSGSSKPIDSIEPPFSDEAAV
jgi:hypothetical protein